MTNVVRAYSEQVYQRSALSGMRRLESELARELRTAETNLELIRQRMSRIEEELRQGEKAQSPTRSEREAGATQGHAMGADTGH